MNDRFLGGLKAGWRVGLNGPFPNGEELVVGFSEELYSALLKQEQNVNSPYPGKDLIRNWVKKRNISSQKPSKKGMLINFVVSLGEKLLLKVSYIQAIEVSNLSL